MKKVLIIEDEKALRDIYALILGKEGFTVETAENGKVGLEKLKTFNPDVITLDILMPVMDGIAFLKSANLNQEYPNVKTIVVSNFSDVISEADAKIYGVVQFFLKANISPLELATAVKKYSI